MTAIARMATCKVCSSEYSEDLLGPDPGVCGRCRERPSEDLLDGSNRDSKSDSINFGATSSSLSLDDVGEWYDGDAWRDF